MELHTITPNFLRCTSNITYLSFQLQGAYIVEQANDPPPGMDLGGGAKFLANSLKILSIFFQFFQDFSNFFKCPPYKKNPGSTPDAWLRFSQYDLWEIWNCFLLHT